ncbi:hypothetical protein HPB51_021596 [Rhipicephalus microplus]|uniref:Uncharacterized protein n=1 Tax=Rhipicephalus microplus TaxID=6941 RepID=A0A9J6EI95_RHIMP|nr:hypothetical protein HPB51_021596 [Rhipicephalus microplus]
MAAAGSAGVSDIDANHRQVLRPKSSEETSEAGRKVVATRQWSWHSSSRVGCVHGTESGAKFTPWPWRRTSRDLANERARHPSLVEAARLSGVLSGGGGAVMPRGRRYLNKTRYCLHSALHWSEVDWPCAPEQSHTVFLVAADERGNACSFINSNFLGFGCAIVEQYGFSVHHMAGQTPNRMYDEVHIVVLQCRGRGFSTVAGHPNCAGPSKKPYHTLMPVLVTDDASGDWLAALGTMGGYTQPQVDLQIFLAMLEGGLDPQSALDAPRLYIGDARTLRVDDPLYLEEGFPEEVAESLRRRGHRIEPHFLSSSPGSSRSMAHIVTRGSWWDRVSRRSVYDGPPILWFGCEPRSDGIAAAAPHQDKH